MPLSSTPPSQSPSSDPPAPTSSSDPSAPPFSSSRPPAFSSPTDAPTTSTTTTSSSAAPPPSNQTATADHMQPSTTATTDSAAAAAQGVFSAWGFDVNSVTNNMTSILSATGETVGGLGGLFGVSLTSANGDANEAYPDDSSSLATATTTMANDHNLNSNNNNNNTERTDGNVDHLAADLVLDSSTVAAMSTPQGDIEDEQIGVAAKQIATAAGAELEHASRAAQATLGKAAEELGKGWGTLNSFLDDMLAPEVGGMQSSGGDGMGGGLLNSGGGEGDGGGGGGLGIGAVMGSIGIGGGGGGGNNNGTDLADLEEMISSADMAKGDVNGLFRALFPHLNVKKADDNDEEEEEEEVVDHYKCCMIQKYRCYLNNATPEVSFQLQGRVFVTMSNVAMYVTDDGGAFGGRSAFGVNIPFSQIVKIQKGAKSMLRVVTKAQTSFIFARFESDTHFAGALSLLEQLTAAASTTAALPQVEQPRVESEEKTKEVEENGNQEDGKGGELEKKSETETTNASAQVDT